MKLDPVTGLLAGVRFAPSPNCDDREFYQAPEAIIVHCISLPPGEYGGVQIEQLFSNTLDANEHDYFRAIAHLRVSAHFLIRRNGEIIQFVPTTKRAWHAGDSFCLGRPKVNDFSIGIELEGWDCDEQGFTDDQYGELKGLIGVLRTSYPDILENHIFAHSDIAPGRKPDPGPYFDWTKVFN